MARVLGIIGNFNPVERRQSKDVDSIEGDSFGAGYRVPACVHKSCTSISLSQLKERRQRDSYISYVPFVELMPATQNSIRGLGGLPVVDWFHQACFAGSNTDTTLKSIKVVRLLAAPLPFWPPMASIIPSGPNEAT